MEFDDIPNQLSERALLEVRRYIAARLRFNVECIELKHRQRALRKRIQRRRENREDTSSDEELLAEMTLEGVQTRIVLAHIRRSLRAFGPVVEDMYIRARTLLLERTGDDIRRTLNDIDTEYNNEMEYIPPNLLHEQIDLCDMVPEHMLEPYEENQSDEDEMDME